MIHNSGIILCHSSDSKSGMYENHKIQNINNMKLDILLEISCRTIALVVLGQFSDIYRPSENWPRTIRAMVLQLVRNMILTKYYQNVVGILY